MDPHISFFFYHVQKAVGSILKTGQQSFEFFTDGAHIVLIVPFVWQT